MMQKKKKIYGTGYLTVYLALTITIMLSLCLALIEGVRANAIRVETECVTDIGLNSILAEYHRELFAQYNLFAIDASYGTARTGVGDMAQHLRGYLERNFSQEDIFLADFLYKDFLSIDVKSIEMTGASIMTDESGAVFRRNAAEAIWDDCNLSLLQDLQQWLQVVEDNGLRERDVSAEKEAADKELGKYNGREIQISETEQKIIKIDNPTAKLEKMRKKGILQYVVKDVHSLSEKVLEADEPVMRRMNQGEINRGNIPVKELAEGEELLERFLFQEYLLKYMGSYGEEKESGALSYQIEYLLMGNDADVTNLKQTVNILFAIREAANISYLFGDREKCAQAEALALLTASLLGVPEAATVLKNVLLFGWSFAESMRDVELLLSGDRVPLLKDKSTWQFNMQDALQYGGEANEKEGDEQDDNQETASGLSYEDYLRLFMMFVDLDTLTGRAMNMVEADIRLTPGNQFFRLDNCYEQVEFCIHVSSEYGYDYEITRRKGY